jgi:hypothetical protein
LLAILSFFIGSILSRGIFAAYNAEGAGAIGGALITAFYLAFAVLQFFPCLFLYQFSVRLKAALSNNDQVQLSQSLKSQKSLFKYIGVLTIIVLSFYALALIIGVISAAITHH